MLMDICSYIVPCSVCTGAVTRMLLKALYSSVGCCVRRVEELTWLVSPLHTYTDDYQYNLIYGSDPSYQLLAQGV